MKRFVFILALLFSSTLAFSQTGNIGLRLGANDGVGAEISYQHLLGSSNRIEFDLGWRDSRSWDLVKLSGIYHWVMPIEGGFYWYVGPGAALGVWDYDDDFPFDDRNNDEGFFLNVAGQVGIEYNFDIPLQLSLDVRPEVPIINRYDDFDFDLALGIRYRF